MWADLKAHPEVLYGLAIALAVVVLLTPAVGGMARLLGVVDRPDERRLNKRPIPRLGGLAIFLGILVPALAFLDLSGEMRGIVLGAAVACVVGAVDDFKGLDPLPKLGGQVLAAAIPAIFGTWIDHFTFPLVGAVDLPAWVGVPLTILWIVAVMNMVNFLDGLDGLASGVCGIAGATFAVIALSLGKVDAAILSAVVAGACVGFLRHNFFPGPDLHGRLRGARPRVHSRLGLGVGAPQDRVDGRPLPPAPRARRADHRHVVRRREAAEVRPTDLLRRPLAPASSVRRDRLLATSRRPDDVGVDRIARGSRAGDALHPLPRGRPVASWETVVVVGIALGAVAFSVYIVRLLEIVKSSGARPRRRSTDADVSEETSGRFRRSA